MISIDPGVKGCGVAVWRHGTLIGAAYETDSDPRMLAHKVPTNDDTDGDLVIEMPQVYARSKSKGDPNDLIKLAVMVGRILQSNQGLQWVYLPRQWKGQVPKDILTERTKRALTNLELDRVYLPKAPSLHHNVWDAIGIGLHHLHVTGVRRAK